MHTYSEASCITLNLSDGIHGYPCTEHFLICQKSVAQWYRCPEGTYYDNVNIKCKHPAINFCKSKSICATLADGNYGRQCGLGYLTCRDSINDFVACSSHTVFNTATGKCENVSEVPDCKKDTANAPTFIYFPRTDAVCSKFHDGIYAFPCDPDFIICISHEQIQFTCPANTVFNADTEWCEDVANVPSCQKKSPEKFTFALPLY
uniref:Peritrophin-44 n=1 Tax=Panagrellus redivivus TaxID=6233 RepID=A0A7E4ULQ1_PANRE